MDRGRLLLIVAIVGSLIRNCQASDDDDGSTSCNAPSITRVNFEDSIEILNGTNRTLSCEIRSDTPLKGEPIWRKDFSELPADLEYIVKNASCSDSTSKTCIVSNLTLINAVRFERIILYEDQYTGNYTLTAENNCSNTTVYVEVNILIPQSCVVDYNKPPQLKIAPPSVVQAVEGSSVTITAQYEGSMNDNNLGVYWCVYKTQHDYYCYNSNDDDDNYTVSIDGCPPDNPSCCYFTVLLKIQSVTRNLTLQSMVVWQQHPHNYIPGNSKLVANVYPTLDTNPNNKCVEVKEGRSIPFTCIYNVSTDPNVTITTWKFNEELLEHDSSHYTIITHYGSDPVNFNRVLSRITLSNVIPDNAGTYTCQCAYNPKFFNNKDVVSEAANFCLKVKPGFPLAYIIIIVVVVIIVLLMAVVALILFCCWKRRKNKNSDQKSSENTRLLSEIAGNHSINNPYKPRSSSSRKRSPSRSPKDDASSTDDDASSIDHKVDDASSTDDDDASSIDHKVDDVYSTDHKAVDDRFADQTENQDKFVSGQGLHSSVAGLIPNHQKPYRQSGDMVTGGPAPQNGHSLTESRQGEATDSKPPSSKPLLNCPPSNHLIESERDGSGRQTDHDQAENQSENEGLIHSHHCDDKVTTPVTAHSTTPVTACSTSLESFDKGPSGNDHASHQKPYHQPDDMVTGATGGVTSGKIHEQLPAHSTSLESFDKGPSGNSHASQLVTSESHIQDVQDGSNKAAHTKKPVIPVLSTKESIESEAEVPRTSHAAAVRPSVSKPIVPQASNPAKNDIPSVEWLATEASGCQGFHDRILNSIAPDFTANVNMDTLLPYLQKHCLVTGDEEYHLGSIIHSSSKKGQMLLGYLKTKGHGSLQMILCCLNSAHEHIGHKGVADKLKRLMEAKNIKCADFCSDCHCKKLVT